MNKNNRITKNQFYFPAEWQQHRATWLAWPYDEITFPDRVTQVEEIFATIIYHLHQVELVELLVLNAAMRTKVIAKLNAHKNKIDLKRIIFHEVDYADVWLRDYGPTFLLNSNSADQKTAYVKWQYNAYGNKFPDLLKDNEVFNILNDELKKLSQAQERIEAPIVMEGGAIEVNGRGTLLTTEECLLNPNRNGKITKNKMENYLKNYLGATKIIWLKQGLVNDHTDGHIDEIARFIDAKTIAVAHTENKTNPNFSILNDNLKLLEESRDQDGKPFNIIKLPLPEFFYEGDEGRELAPASYANFYLANKLILVPQFADKNDQTAIAILQSHFPRHKVVGIDCRDLIYGGGTIHCITQQWPSSYR